MVEGLSPLSAVCAPAHIVLLILVPPSGEQCMVRPTALKAQSLAMGFLSIVIIFAEATMWVSRVNKADGRDVSLVSLIIEKYPPGSDFATKTTVGLLLFYNVNAAFYSIFRLGMFEQIFHVVPRSTDAVSLLFSCTQFCRYAAPLCYNCLNLLPIVHRLGTKSVFEQQMNQQLPTVALNYMLFFPCILPFYCLCISFNMFDRLVAAITPGGANALKFSSEPGGGALDEESKRGEALLQVEKDGVRAGLGIGDNHASYSGRRAGRPLEPVDKSGVATASRFLKSVGGSAAAAVASAASGKGLERKGLLSDVGSSDGGRPASAGQGLSARERLKEKAERVKQGEAAKAERPWGMSAAAAAVPSAASSSRTPVSTAAVPPAARPSAGASGSLDSIFSGLGREPASSSAAPAAPAAAGAGKTVKFPWA